MSPSFPHRLRLGLYAVLTHLLVVLGLLLCVGITTVQAQAMPSAGTPTTVSGDITTDTTWSLAKSPYRVSGRLTVRSGVKLTVEPGVVVEVADSTAIVVRGELIAEGGPDTPILFTGVTKTPGAWFGLNAGNTPTAPARLSFHYVTVEYAGLKEQYNGGALSIEAPVEATIANSVFRLGGSNGVNLNNLGDSVVQISDSAFLDNQLAALRLSGSIHQDPLFARLRAEGNGVNAIVMPAIRLETPNHLLTNAGLPYQLEDGFTVAAGSRLVVQPGVELDIESDFHVQGELTALGSAAEPIHFTRIGEGPNWWGLNIASGYDLQAKAQLDHVIIEYGGQTNGVPSVADANLIVNSAVVTITNSIIRNGGSNGIAIHRTFREKPHAVYIAGTQIADHPGSAVRCTSGSCGANVHNLNATGNGFDGITEAGAVFEPEVWRNQGLPYLVEGYGAINATATLTVEPGVEIRFAKDAQLVVNGSLIALGTAQAPIRFTGTREEPGWWRGITVNGVGASLLLNQCDIGYGGGGGSALLAFAAPTIFVSDCRFHHSAGPAIVRSGGRWTPVVWYSRFEENAAGVQSLQPSALNQIDARNNWWGAASGPTHPTNPNGTGATASNAVIFDPWLTSPDYVAPSDLEVRLSGVDRYAPGQTVQFALFYSNPSAETLKDAVLRVALPSNSDYLDSTGGAIYWPERRQIFWKLGDIAPGSRGIFALRVRYDWGLRIGLRSTILAQLSGSNISPQPFDLAAYLDYTPILVTNEIELSPAQVEADRATIADLNALYTQAGSEGYVFGSALQRSYSSGDLLNQAILLKFEPATQQMSAFLLWWQGQTATGARVDASSFTVYKPGGALRYDLQTQQWQDVTAQVITAGPAFTWKDCMANCIEEKLPSYLVKKYIKILSTVAKVANCVKAAGGDPDAVLDCSKLFGKVIPGYSEAVDLGKCNSDCQACEQAGEGCNDDRCHCCTADKYRCSDDDWLYGTFGIDVIKIRRCSVTGHYLAEEVLTVCALCDKCIDGEGGPACVNKSTLPGTALASQMQAPTAQLGQLSSPSSQQCQQCVIAADPNDIEGPEGDLLPGQLVTYTIHYENVGAGQAYDVFVVNELDENLDLATLQLPDNATLSAATRTLYFAVGVLAAKGQPGASGAITYSVRVKAALPSGTVITNQAVVHFPSVPEKTPTNIVANTVVPLVAQPQMLEGVAGQPLTIHLQGHDAGNTPLSYGLVTMPLYGELTGSAPVLTYTPTATFAGQDHLLFTVSNGSTTSRVAAVTIQVQAAPGDTTAPTVRWTSPAANQQINSRILIGSGALPGPLYAPLIQVQFSEPMAPQSFANDSIEILGPDNHAVVLEVNYDAVIDQTMVLLHEPLQADSRYTVTVKPSVTDLSGNALADEVTWTFQIGEASQPHPLYLPLVQK